ncbi:predicted protein [Uncinocarpus reesii 1704]|uniref:Uncharacterized protein n=1 Tax=Uncinocarpus reesii (strain UAMH 1704) TaxID=336963 RepID=C4JDV0_UNCRE|nr:uncharacterized protein UREG_00577 [Uncinocarpus reesii 1704]EEP75730.1 predicted protein [Uncinocarpus reesii 1704]
MSPYRLVEPLHSAPTANRRQVVYTGRPGAGNTVGLQNNTVNNLPSLKRISSTRPKQFCSSGGSLHTCSSSELAIFSFDEELEYELRREKDVAPVFHVGRSGGTNTFHQDNQLHFNSSCNYSGNYARKQSTTSSMGSSSASANLEKAAWNKRDADSWRASFKHPPS